MVSKWNNVTSYSLTESIYLAASHYSETIMLVPQSAIALKPHLNFLVEKPLVPVFVNAPSSL